MGKILLKWEHTGQEWEQIKARAAQGSTQGGGWWCWGEGEPGTSKVTLPVPCSSRRTSPSLALPNATIWLCLFNSHQNHLGKRQVLHIAGEVHRKHLKCFSFFFPLSTAEDIIRTFCRWFSSKWKISTCFQKCNQLRMFHEYQSSKQPKNKNKFTRALACVYKSHPMEVYLLLKSLLEDSRYGPRYWILTYWC